MDDLLVAVEPISRLRQPLGHLSEPLRATHVAEQEGVLEVDDLSEHGVTK
jgi:hypothetical protein